MSLHEGGNYNDMIGFEPPSNEKPEQKTTASSPESQSRWLHAHPYLAMAIGFGGLIVLGGALVIGRSDVDPSRSSGAWGGAGGFFAGTIRNINPSRMSPEDIVRLQSPQDSYATIPIYALPQNPDGTSPADDGITELLAQLVQNIPVTAGSTTTATPEGFSFIPQGLVSTELVQEKKRTPEQEVLFIYGNQVGAFVKGYESLHYGSPQILKDHIEDRNNPDKIRGVKILGNDMQQFGIDLRNLAGIPTLAAATHKEYANAYIRAGRDLIKVSETTTDEAFVNAITTYNTSVEKLTTQFVAIAELFGMYEVTFSASNEGSIFMFAPNLSLLQ